MFGAHWLYITNQWSDACLSKQTSRSAIPHAQRERRVSSAGGLVIHHADCVAMEPRDVNSTESVRGEGYQRSDSDAAMRMRRALAAVANGKGSRLELEQAAHALVTELKQSKFPPEQMLLHIKEILAEAGMRANYASPSLDGPSSDASTVYQDVIAWSIRSYYDGADGRAKPGH